MDFLTGQKDTDLLILEKLEDRDLIRTCLTNKSANRLCKNEDFWRNRFLKKWGATNVVPKSWRNFYLSYVKYLDMKNKISLKIDEKNFIVENAARERNIDMVKYMIEKGFKEFEFGLEEAAKGGDINIVELMIENGAGNLASPLSSAAYGGYNDIVELLVNWMEKAHIGYYARRLNLEYAIINAVLGNHLDTLKLLVEKGASDLNNRGLLEARRAGYDDIVNFLTELKNKK